MKWNQWNEFGIIFRQAEVRIEDKYQKYEDFKSF
jgi:hypothetical protein